MNHPSAFARIVVTAILMLLTSLFSRGFSFMAWAQNPRTASPAIPYGQPRELSRVKDALINESSGIAASNFSAKAFWTNNDSGDSARLFLFGKNGETLAVAAIKDAQAVDWEDIASYRAGKDRRILIADTGDNAKWRTNYALYIIREPKISASSSNHPPLNIVADILQTIHFSYEDTSHDCEAVGVDPVESVVYLTSKEPGLCKVYALPIPSKGSTSPNIAKAIATIKIPFVTAMDISPDGRRAVILTYGDAFEFARAGVETWAQAFAREPRTIQMPPRKQGESICYGVDGKTLYLTSEGLSQPFWEVPVMNRK